MENETDLSNDELFEAGCYSASDVLDEFDASEYCQEGDAHIELTDGQIHVYVV